MKWKRKAGYGDVRIVSGFLWLPRKIRDETRWFEHATWKQMWNGLRRGRWRGLWEDISWETPEDPLDEVRKFLEVN